MRGRILLQMELKMGTWAPYNFCDGHRLFAAQTWAVTNDRYFVQFPAFAIASDCRMSVIVAHFPRLIGSNSGAGNSQAESLAMSDKEWSGLMAAAQKGD